MSTIAYIAGEVRDSLVDCPDRNVLGLVEDECAMEDDDAYAVVLAVAAAAGYDRPHEMSQRQAEEAILYLDREDLLGALGRVANR